MIHRAAAGFVVLALAACAGVADDGPVSCPRVESVAGLDRLDIVYPGSDTPVRTALDITQVACEAFDDEFLVGAAVAIRVADNRPPGALAVPYTVFLDTPDGMTATRAERAIIPAGASGTIEYYEYRFAPEVAQDDVLVRLLYALVPDDEELERLSREVPRP